MVRPRVTGITHLYHHLIMNVNVREYDLGQGHELIIVYILTRYSLKQVSTIFEMAKHSSSLMELVKTCTEQGMPLVVAGLSAFVSMAQEL